MRRALLLLVVILPVSTSAAAGAIGTTSTQSNSSRSLTVDDRIAAQRAIEEVYWRHRIWPKDNPAPKPSLDSLMPASTLHAKVEDYLKKSNALESWWHRPITGEQLQAELDRMAKGSHDPKLLQELFDALHGDPFLVAETLARPVLVERLTRNWFASDRRIHGATRVKAETALAACRDVSCMKDMDGIYGESTVRLRHDDDARRRAVGKTHRAAGLSPDEAVRRARRNG
jgi:hypothetical protein